MIITAKQTKPSQTCAEFLFVVTLNIILSPIGGNFCTRGSLLMRCLQQQGSEVNSLSRGAEVLLPLAVFILSCLFSPDPFLFQPLGWLEFQIWVANQQPCIFPLPLTWMQQQQLPSVCSGSCRGTRSDTCPLLPKQTTNKWISNHKGQEGTGSR